MFTSSRPPDSRSNVDAMRAAVAGAIMPGRIATRYLSRCVAGMSAEAATQASSQERPVGSSTPP